jgi:hypothetical protein
VFFYGNDKCKQNPVNNSKCSKIDQEEHTSISGPVANASQPS